jgi:hypothetical protein
MLRTFFAIPYDECQPALNLLSLPPFLPAFLSSPPSLLSSLSFSHSILQFSQEFKTVNTEAQDVLSYFNTKSGAILPYYVQVSMGAIDRAVMDLLFLSSIVLRDRML